MYNVPRTPVPSSVFTSFHPCSQFLPAPTLPLMQALFPFNHCPNAAYSDLSPASHPHPSGRFPTKDLFFSCSSFYCLYIGERPFSNCLPCNELCSHKILNSSTETKRKPSQNTLRSSAKQLTRVPQESDQ